ncbi:hypothetical protein Scep_005491 [Stephania cephalantha]|uniref:Uncharacterized protein n=1 Tax=Stephania cephalantha TaxID=152367 RepID=A0AAP0PWF6_9MAGN
MEGERKQVGSSSSSISSDLFGSKSNSNSSRILDSVFPPPPPSIRGSGYVRNDAVGTRRKQDADHQPWSAKNGNPGMVNFGAKSGLISGNHGTWTGWSNGKSELGIVWIRLTVLTLISRDSSKSSENGTPSKSRMSSLFQDEKTEPCYLSSSLYYGGQDLYSNPSNRGNTGSSHIFKKDSDSDDPNDSASRGNWWQGSLYY